MELSIAKKVVHITASYRLTEKLGRTLKMEFNPNKCKAVHFGKSNGGGV